MRNRVFTEGCTARTENQIGEDATEEFRDRRAGSPRAPAMEGAPRGERDDVVWSAVLGYN